MDVPYMTPELRKAIKMKRTYAKEYAHNRTEENWELKRKWRNKATKCRRMAIREFWKQKADDLKSKPSGLDFRSSAFCFQNSLIAIRLHLVALFLHFLFNSQFSSVLL